MAADGSIILDTRIDTSGFDALSSSISGLPKALGKIGKAIGAAFAIGSITQFSKEAIQLGSDLQEVQNVVDVTFGNMNGAIEKFAQNAAEQFGLSELAAKQYTSTIGAMLKSMGFTAEQAAEMSMELAGLAGDMASFYNLETDEAFYKLRSGISGETEPLKQLGINLSVANLEQYAFAQGIEKSYKAMTQQEQALLRYNYLLSVTSDAQGDFSRTSSSWANQTRILSLQFETIKATIGQGLINALTPVISVINTILSGLQAVARAFQQFTALLFGNAAGSSGVSNQIQDIADGYGSAAGGAEDLAEGTKKAGEAAKRYLSSFDEITKLNEPSAESGGSGSGGVGGGVGGLGEFGGLTADANIQDNISPKIEALVNKIKELIAPLQEIDFTPLQNSLIGLGDSFSNLGSIIMEDLEWAWFNILVPWSEWRIEDFVPASVDLLRSEFDLLSSVLEPVSEGLQKVFDFLTPVFEFIGSTAIQIIGLFSDAFDRLSQVFREKTPEIIGIISGIGEIVAMVWYTIQPILSVAIQFISNLFRDVVEIVSIAISTIIDVLYGIIEFIAGVFSGDWQRAWNGIVEIFTGIWDGIESLLEFAWNGLINLLNSIINSIVSALSDAVNFVKGIFGFGGSNGGSTSYATSPAIAAYSVTPEVPYLAKGAVLPANKPFLAMVGDQKNGTNIEAPLDTIKQALSEVLLQQNGSDRVAELLEILISTVEGIEVGDDVIGKAAARYNRRTARAGGY